MTDQVNSHTALELLAEYNDHRNQRDKAIEHIEGRIISQGNRPSYDDLFKENVKLRLQIEEQATEIDSLMKVIEGLKNSKSANNEILLGSEVSNEENGGHLEIALPPRSADRKRNAKNLSIPIPGISAPVDSQPSPSVPQIDITSSMPKNEDKSDNSVTRPKATESIVSPNTSISNTNLSTPNLDASPATSVQYTTSRISIASPNSPRRAIVQTRVRSPQSANRVAAVINNQVHSPLRSDLGSNQSVNLSEKLTSSPSPSSALQESHGLIKSPVPRTDGLKLAEKVTDFSPISKQKINNFAEFLEDTFGEIDNSSPAKERTKPIHPPPPPSFNSSSKGTSPSVKLGSPVILSRKDNTTDKDSTIGKTAMHSSLSKNEAFGPRTVSSNTRKESTESLLAKSAGTANPSNLQISNNSDVKRQHATSISSGKSSAYSLKSDIPLFVQPEEFESIRMDILSTLYHESDSSTYQQQLLFSVIDRKSDKEMFKFSKSVQKLFELDAFLRPKMSSLTLPSLPEKTVFESLVPIKVDDRRQRLNQYFRTILSIPEFPPNVGLRIAQFISTDTVMNPMILGDTIREGSLMMRRVKALTNGFNWRARYGVLSGEVLQLYDRGQSAERIRLKQSSIELLPNLPEDKYGTRNGFVINEHKKGGLSSTSKFFLCAETSKERELWVSAVSEYIMNPLIPPSSSTGSISTGGDSAPSFTKTDNSNGLEQIYVTDLTNEVNQSTNSTNPSPHEADESADYDRETRRLKMRSFFPFKKLTSNALSLMSDDNEAVEYVETEPKFSDTSIARSLETMNLSDDTPLSVVFGSSLEKCLQLSSQVYQGKYELPSVVYRCLEFLYKNYGIQEEGIFRLSGSSALIKSLQEQFDKDYDVDLSAYNRNLENVPNTPSGTYIDVNTVSGLLKLYLRKLPHLIFGEENYSSFKTIVDRNHENATQIAIEFRDLIRSGKIPPANVSLMYALFELLVRIQENNAYNKMNLRNLCIVFSPTLNIPVTILQPLIIDFACIFKNEDPVRQEERENLDIHIPHV